MALLAPLGALLPAAAAAHAEGDQEVLRTISIEGSRILAILSLGLGGALMGVAPALFQVWLGRPYPHLEVIFDLLIVAYLINNLTGIGTVLTQAIGRPSVEAEYALMSSGINVVLTVALVVPFGLYGVLIGTVIGSVIGLLYFLWRFHRLMRIPLWNGLGIWLWRLPGSVGTAAVVVRLLIAAIPTGLWEHRLGAAVLVTVGSVLYLGLLLVGTRMTKFGSTLDVELLRRVLPTRAIPLLESRVARIAGVGR
jgi:O-antigen/teichoic acid export membrane protein